MEETKIYIIGAGLSGLVSALELEKAGYSPIILEASDRIGGRVKTDVLKGFRMDHGFQVLLTAYPETQKYLDYSALNLKLFSPGAVIFGENESYIISDPLRNPLKIVSMAFSKVGTFLDKVKMFSLTQDLKKKSEAEIFASESKPTLQYLQEYGFSPQIIENFFLPFFRGIFLEPHLNTSSRMFEFVFKMFSIGHAAIPAKGMGEIPEMLRKQLSKTQIFFDSPVDEVKGTEIYLKDGSSLEADKVIIATQPDKVMPQLQGQFAEPQRVTNLYFSTQKSFIARPMIGLIPGTKGLINNIVYMSDVSSEYSSEGRALLSVTVLDHDYSGDELVKKVQAELERISRVKAEYFHHEKTYEIGYALPKLEDLKYEIPPTEAKIVDNVYLAGDFLLNGSINASMTSGRIAAQAVIGSLMPVH
ncbi:NAD(P)/FAD-dependent oxidoreductase [Algoriphagus sediminis]|uniref:NAD(P)/FAD-dependent oxidoreductase n=1 Tax=Algoriphagus sediminis TaxID=3057113 RepID=A0ABT7YAN4_9BACT|nr:NAD(P)/FAD-dependent oxidoreductase [Algoriphagus sediminis]MDN3203583.1 NAD(P)/FAD-dependent oxidoreductase [Algoriphagus sediminis]